MTAPVVGQVSVEVLGSVTNLASSIRKELKAAFKDLDLNKSIRESLGNTKIKLPVEADFKPETIGEKVRQTKAPKVPVEVDPLMAQFQAELRRETQAIAKTVNAKIPIGAETAGFRAELGAELAAIQKQLKAKIPTEPADKAEYALKLRAAVKEASEKVEAKVKIQVDKDSGIKAIKGAFGGLSSTLGGAFSGGSGGPFGFLTAAIPSISGITSAVGDLGASLQKMSGASAQAGGGLAGGFEAAIGPIGIVIGLVVAVGAAVAAAEVGAFALDGALALLTTGLAAAAGAAAAIPAALAGAAAVVGTLGLGFSGIGDAVSAVFNPKKTGGGGAGQNQAQQSRQIAAAERSLAQAEQGVTDAQQRARLAQVAVNQARKDAAEDLEDMSRALQGAKLDEADATQAVQDALLALNTAKLSGNLPDITRANLAYQRAQLTLENTKDAATDLGEKQAIASKKGVEGSDKVQQALRDQASALEAVKQAQDGVLSAQDSLTSASQKTATAAAAAAAKLLPLAKNAQAFVDALKELKPAFENLRLDVQNRLFAGLDVTVRGVWTAWRTQLHTTLGSFADTFNGFFRNLGASLSTPEFIKNIAAGAEGARAGLESIGTAVTTSLVPALGKLAAAAAPFLKQAGAEIAQIITDFGTWIDKAKDSGALSTFFDRAETALHSIFTTGRLAFKITGQIIGILTGVSPTIGKTPLDSFNDGLQKISDWLAVPANQAKLQKFVTDLQTGLANFGAATTKVDGWLNKLGDPKKSSSIGETIGRALIAGIAAGIGGFFKDHWLEMLSPFYGLYTGVKKLFGINSPSTLFAEIGRDLMRGLVVGIGDMFGSLGAKIGRIGSIVGNAVGDAGSWLYSTGRNLVIGLRNGITSLTGWLKNEVVNWARQVIPDPLHDFFGIASPSKLMAEMGGHLAAGLAIGMTGGAGEVESAARHIAAKAIPKVSPHSLTLGMSDASIRSSLAVSEQRSLEARWARGATGDQLLDGLRKLIEFRYGGDVDKALSKG